METALTWLIYAGAGILSVYLIILVVLLSIAAYSAWEDR